MDFNVKLQNLISEAERNGYEFSNGKFEKTKLEIFPVMEMFFINNSTYEDTGYYHIFKKTVKISNEDFKKVKINAKKNDYKKIHINYSTEEENSISEILDVIFDYDKSNIDFMNTNTGGDIDIRCNEYEIYSDKDECVDVWFTKPEEDDDFPRGFISFYEMTMTDFEKADDVNLHLKKFMRDN